VSNIYGALKNAGGNTEDLEFETLSNEPPKSILKLASQSQRIASGVSTPAPSVLPVHSTLPTGDLGARELRLRLSALAPVLPFDGSNQRAAEQYQIIRTKILHHGRRPRFVLVSSATSGDGKTVTSINVAASLALKSDARVLLIDGDLRQPSVARTLGIPVEPGLREVLAGQIPFESALIRAAEVPNLYVLPAGGVNARAADLLDSERWRTLVASVRERFTTVICDAPPIATVADYELLQMVADGTVVVARPGHTERHACRKALESVEQTKLIGVVLNCVEDWWLWKTPSYGYYTHRAESNS
jgi:capsular exopolysaccharide synthesis family protein